MIPVTPEILGPTDLAVVPSFLGWLVRQLGRHTPAALLRDQLTVIESEHQPSPALMPRADADRLFREALLASEVGLVKSWLLWAGAAMVTRLWSKPFGGPAIITWLLAALAGSGLLVYGLNTGRPVLVAIALAAPIPFASLWARQWKAGLIAGYAFWPVVFGSLPPWLTYQAYRSVEYLARLLGRLRPGEKRHALPPPVPFEQR